MLTYTDTALPPLPPIPFEEKKPKQNATLSVSLFFCAFTKEPLMRDQPDETALMRDDPDKTALMRDDPDER